MTVINEHRSNSGISYQYNAKLPEYVYHGSYKAIPEPRIIKGKYAKDFGFAFYCTAIKEQAEKYVEKFRTPYISAYRISPDAWNDLHIKILTADTEEHLMEWMKFVVSCRSNKEYRHSYDIVIGPMADDKIYEHIQDYAARIISKEKMLRLCLFRYPTHQIAFCTASSLKYVAYAGAERIKRK